jgi:hypothetical protein
MAAPGQWTVAAAFMHETIHHLHKDAVCVNPIFLHQALGFVPTTNHQGGAYLDIEDPLGDENISSWFGRCDSSRVMFSR